MHADMIAVTTQSNRIVDKVKDNQAPLEPSYGKKQSNLLSNPMLSVSVDLATLDTSYKLNHILGSLLVLAFFDEHHIFKIHPSCGKCKCFTLLSGQIMFHCINLLCYI